MSTSPVTLDLGKSQPISQPVTLDLSQSEPIGSPGKRFTSAAVDQIAEIVKGQVKSYLSGGGGIGQSSSGPTETFNPFHPVETAGYLIPQPIKEIGRASCR